MDLWWIFAAGVLGLVALIILIPRRHRSSVWPVERRVLMTQPEQVLYFRLVSALPDLLVFAQVQLSRCISVRSGVKGWQAWHNKFDRKSLDFVVCRRDMSIICAIELDDSSHKRRAMQRADADKAAALEAAGISLIRFKVSAMPDSAAILNAISTIDQVPPVVRCILTNRSCEVSHVPSRCSMG